MNGSNLLLCGLRLQKALHLCAPDEYKVLGPHLEKFLSRTMVDLPPQEFDTKAFAAIFDEHKISGPLRELKVLNDTLECFAQSLEHYARLSESHNALLNAIISYRSKLNPIP